MSQAEALYTQLETLVAESQTAVEPATLHGLIVGSLCGGRELADDQVRRLLEKFLEPEGPVDYPALLALREAARNLLADESLALVIPLADEDDLQLSTAQLGLWCEGFLTGIGTSADQDFEKRLSADGQQALADLMEVARVETDDCEEEDFSLNDFVEVSEYVRMAVLMIYTDSIMAPKTPSEEKPAPTQIH